VRAVGVTHGGKAAPAGSCLRTTAVLRSRLTRSEGSQLTSTADTSSRESHGTGRRLLTVRGFCGLVVVVGCVGLACFGGAPASAQPVSGAPNMLMGSLTDVGQYSAATDTNGDGGGESAYSRTLTATDLTYTLDQPSSPNYTPGATTYTLTGGVANYTTAPAYTSTYVGFYNSDASPAYCTLTVQESVDTTQPLTGSLLFYASGSQTAVELSVSVPTLGTVTAATGAGLGGPLVGPLPGPLSDAIVGNGTYDPTTQTVTLDQTTTIPLQAGSSPDLTGTQTHTATGSLAPGCTQETNATPPGGSGFMQVSGMFTESPTRWQSCGGTVRIDGLDIMPPPNSTNRISLSIRRLGRLLPRGR